MTVPARSFRRARASLWLVTVVFCLAYVLYLPLHMVTEPHHNARHHHPGPSAGAHPDHHHGSDDHSGHDHHHAVGDHEMFALGKREMNPGPAFAPATPLRMPVCAISFAPSPGVPPDPIPPPRPVLRCTVPRAPPAA